MRRSLLGLVLAVLLVATAASASDWYCAARFGGMSSYWLYPLWMDDEYFGDYYDGADTPYILRHIEGGIFDYRQFDIGLNKDPLYFEFGFGYTSSKWEYNDPDSDYSDTEKLNWYTFGLAGLYKFVDPDPIELDAGLRFQLHKAKGNWDWGYENAMNTEESDISGWSMGPLLRARWYFADGALALAPEMYFKYTSLTYKETWEYDRDNTSESDLTQMDTEYSIALEFHF